MVKALLCALLPLWLAGCSFSSTPKAGDLTVSASASWPYTAPVHYVLDEQYQFAGEKVEAWFEPVLTAVDSQLQRKGWQPATVHDANLVVAVGMLGPKDQDGALMAERLHLPVPEHKADDGVLALVLLDPHLNRVVWSATLALQPEGDVDDAARQQLSQTWIERMLATLPH